MNINGIQIEEMKITNRFPNSLVKGAFKLGIWDDLKKLREYHEPIKLTNVRANRGLERRKYTDGQREALNVASTVIKRRILELENSNN